MIRPIFIFSVPRAGSTLVQRVIAAHPDVATANEPWLLLPLLYALRENGARSEYWHETAAGALRDFCRTLPAGEDDYRRAVRDMALDLYSKSAGEVATYFLDKTPHYHFVAQEIIELFADGKFVFLWRHPLGVAASMIDTFRGGRFEPFEFRVHLCDGVEHLVDAWEANADRAHAVRYEDLLDGEDGWRRLFAYLELDFDPGLLERFTEVALEGRYGDPTGRRRYRSLTAAPAAKWRTTMAGPVRSAWARWYVHRLGAERLSAMGYDEDTLLGEIAALDGAFDRRAAVDAAQLVRSRASEAIRRAALHVTDAPRPRGDVYPGAHTFGDRVRDGVSARLRGGSDQAT